MSDYAPAEQEKGRLSYKGETCLITGLLLAERYPAAFFQWADVDGEPITDPESRLKADGNAKRDFALLEDEARGLCDVYDFSAWKPADWDGNATPLYLIDKMTP